MNVVFDLDDTLADSAHRVAKHLYKPGFYAQPEHRIHDVDWEAFFEECHLDQPIIPVLKTFKAFSALGYDNQVWTGRCASVRSKSMSWFNSVGINDTDYSLFRMRPIGDRTDDDLLKEQWLHESIANGWTPDLVFEDRTRLVEMYRRNGIRCLQVGPGDF